MKPEMEEELGKAVDKNKFATAERMIRAGKLSEEDIAEYSGLTLKQLQS